MSENWFYEFNGKPTGPVSINELMRILSGHESPKDILVWGNGFTVWQRAGTVPALNAQFVRSSKLPEAPFHSSSPGWRGYTRLRYLAWAIFAVALLLLAVFAGGAYERYGAQTSREQKVAHAMQAIETAWRMAIDHQYPLVSKCGDDGYKGQAIRHGAILRADVKRTDALINPYVGIVRLTGVIASNYNTSKANGSSGCFRSIDKAIAANADSDLWDIDQVDYTFEYVITDDEMRLDRAVAGSYFPRDLYANLKISPQVWKPLMTQPIK